MAAVPLGIVGCGVIGRHHLRAAGHDEAVELVAVADQLAERAQAAADAHGAARAYGSAAELIADPRVAAVVLALPTAGRAQLAVEALRAGKHVLVEKPPALHAREVEAMLAAQGDRVAGCCSSRLRAYPSSARATELVAAGALGDLREVYCRVHGAAGPRPEQPPPPWRSSRSLNGGGIAVNWSSYDLDYLLGITGWQLEPQLTLARTWPVADHLAARVAPGSDGESHYVALVLCAGGIALHLERSEFSAVHSERAWQIIGSNASLRLEMLPGTSKQLVLDRATDAAGVASEVVWEGSEDPGLQHQMPVSDFCRAIATGGQPMTSLRQALVIQRIFDSIYASADRGAAVPVS